MRKNLKRSLYLLAVALFLALTPVCFDDAQYGDYLLGNIKVETLKAYADAQPVENAQGYIESAADQAGLAPGDFVATIIGGGAIVTGNTFSKAGTTGQRLGQSLQDGLNNLADAADYPAWNTLSDEQQQSWGSADNYHAAKFNSLMNAFGLGDTVDGWYQSGGGNFEWTDDARERLQSLGDVGNRWINGTGNTIQQVLDTLDQDTYEETFIGYIGPTTFEEVNSSDYDSWPENLPSSLKVAKANYIQVVDSSGYYNKIVVSAPVYVLAAYGFSSGKYNNLQVVLFSKTGFMYGTGTNPAVTPSPTRSAISVTYQDNTYYRTDLGLALGRNITALPTSTIPVNTNVGQNYLSQLKNAAPIILFGSDLDIGGIDKMPDYPDDVASDPNQVTYFPVIGINPESTWQNFTESNASDDVNLDEVIALLQRFTFYTTGQLKVHDEGLYNAVGDIGYQIAEIKPLIQQIRDLLANWTNAGDAPDIIGDVDFPAFDQKATDLVETISSLAPFGALLLMSEMVAILSQTGHIDEPEMTFDFNFFPGHEYEVVINLSWLDDLKPVINVVCILMLVFSLAGATVRLIEMEAAS